MRRLLALRDLVHDAVEKITDLVEETHESVAQKPVLVLGMIEPLGSAARAVDDVRRVTAQSVFESVRATNRGVQALSGLGLSLAVQALSHARALASGGEPVVPDRASELLPRLSGFAERAESALNAVLGDFLEARGNDLAIGPSLRSAGRDLVLERAALARALPRATGKVCIFVHGLGCSDSIWDPSVAEGGAPQSFGERLSRELGYTPLALRYNTGRHISQNGRSLSQLLSALLAAYPVPLEEVALVGHSMGGLVARSAAHYGKALDEPWVARLTRLLCIGSPHFGAPLERASNVLASVLRAFDVAGTQVPAKVLNARSAGMKDLRFGYLLDEDWTDRDPDAFLDDGSHHAPFVDGVTYGFIAARAHAEEGLLSELLGDLLVQVPSASGQHHDATRHLPFHMGQVIPGVHHVALTTHPAVYEQLRRFLTEPRNEVLARDVRSAS